ncbi:MAG: 50S ribosomal protein L24 [Verrucomicrobiota bacterium]|nr:50S ribosomal protein L24 [Verrucomicrobiota bacterium]
MKTNVKKGDEVVVIAGNQRGQRSKVLQVLPSIDKILVENVNKRKHFEKKTKENESGSIVEREVPVHISNIMLATRYDTRMAKRKSTTTA